MINANLNEIKNLIEHLRYKCQILECSERIPIDQLIVELDRDAQDRSRFLVIRAANQELSSQDALFGINSSPRNYQELQFIVTLPFFVKDEKIFEISRLILLLNKGIELPGFELSEVDHLIYYRYALIVPEDDLDERILLSLIGMIQLLLEAFTEIFEAVATSGLTFREVAIKAQLLLESHKKNREDLEKVNP